MCSRGAHVTKKISFEVRFFTRKQLKVVINFENNLERMLLNLDQYVYE